MDRSANYFPHLRLREHCRTMIGMILRATESGNLMCDSLLGYRLIPVNFHQHVLIKMSLTRTTVDLPIWIADMPLVLNHTQRTLGNCGIVRYKEIVFPVEEHISWLSNTKKP